MGESLFDKISSFAKERASENPDQVDSAIDKVGDMIDNATGGKYTEQIDSGKGKATDGLFSALGVERQPDNVDRRPDTTE